jgi:hypothetical protein
MPVATLYATITRAASLVRRALWCLALALLAAGAAWPGAARAQSVELSTFEVARSEEGVLLSFTAKFELSHNVEDALMRGVPLYFEAEASVLQSRWYWRDKRVSRAVRNWRLTYQPLTRMYRLSSGGLNQNFETLAEALDVLRRATRWRIAEPGQLDDDGRYYVEFGFRLDTSLLPRPMQLGIGGEAAWVLSVERTARLN